MGDELSAMQRKFERGRELVRPMSDPRKPDYVERGPPSREMQQHELHRVTTRISGALLAFFTTHVGQEFHADDLRRHVAAQCGNLAPGSADRIMRAMRRRGDISYSVVNRASSLYRAGR